MHAIYIICVYDITRPRYNDCLRFVGDRWSIGIIRLYYILLPVIATDLYTDLCQVPQNFDLGSDC